MQTMSENDTLDENQKKANKRPKSSSRFPKQMPSYIVAFAVHETYDDIATAQQMICNKRSLQGSASSVSPTLSSKTMTIDRTSTQKIVDIDLSELKIETKININEGDVGNDHNCDVQNEVPQIKDYLLVDEKREDDINRTESKVNLVESNKTFDVAKSSSKVKSNKSENKKDFESIKKPKSHTNKSSKKKRQNKYTIRNINFKYKKSQKKTEKVCKRSAKLKETLYSNSLSKVVSRTSLLKSVPAKLNIIDATDSILMSDDEINNGSLQSSPSTTKKSFISYSSQDTLRRPGSTSSSRNEGMGSINTVNSVIKIPSEKIIPYKTEVINVSVAVAYNPNINNDVVSKTPEPYRSMYVEIIGNEALVESAHRVISESTSSETSVNAHKTYLQATIENANSDNTLKPVSTCEDTYVVGTSSDMDDSSCRSEDTLAPNSETFMFAENLRPNYPAIDKFDIDKFMNRPALLDTVINMGMFPEINPSTSSAVNFNNNLNNVFITGDATKFINNPTYNGNEALEILNKSSKYILKKAFEPENEVTTIKNLSLPDESAIKAIFNDENKTDSNVGSGETGKYPSSMTELWDRLVMVVETAVKRLETSLTEKIITELKKSFTVFEHTNRITKEEIVVIDVDKDKGDAVLLNKEVSVGKEDIKAEVDEILQCNIVGNQEIDNIMLKLSVEGPKNTPETSKSFQKMNGSKVFKDYFEVLKPPVVASPIVEGKGDTVTVSTAILSELEEVQSLNRVKSFLIGPLTFLRENMLIITSVPAFFIGMLCIYGILVIQLL